MNQNSGKIKASIKKELFDSGKDLFDIIYFLGRGFILSDHLYTYGKVLYDFSEKTIRNKIINLNGKGLLLEKEATNTGTKIYVLPKYVLSKYQSKPSQNVSSVRITGKKLWKNIYVNEYIIQKVLKSMIHSHTELSINKILELLEYNFITLYTTQSRSDIFELYSKFSDEYNCIENDAFNQDFYALAGDLYLYAKNFLKQKIELDYSEPLHQRKIRQFEKDSYKTEEDKNKHCYNFYQLVMNGFFFNGSVENRTFEIGLFELNKLTFEKVYKQSAYILLMLNRYLGYMPKIILKIYISDYNTASILEDEAKRKVFNMKKHEFSEYPKKYELYKSLGIDDEYWNNIEVKYINYDLKNKYKL